MHLGPLDREHKPGPPDDERSLQERVRPLLEIDHLCMAGTPQNRVQDKEGGEGTREGMGQ